MCEAARQVQDIESGEIYKVLRFHQSVPFDVRDHLSTNHPLNKPARAPWLDRPAIRWTTPMYEIQDRWGNWAGVLAVEDAKIIQ